MNRVIPVLALALLAGCQSANNSTQTAVYATAQALAAADVLAIQYVTLPLCGPAHARPLCSDAEASAKIKSAAQTAHDAVKVAEMAGDNASLAAAQAAVTALQSLIPKVS